MITKRTDKKVKRARSELASALITNRLLGYQENGLRAILTSLDKWLEAHGRPEEKEIKIDTLKKAVALNLAIDVYAKSKRGKP